LSGTIDPFADVLLRMEENITSVFFSMPASSKAARICPTESSISAITSASRARRDFPLKGITHDRSRLEPLHSCSPLLGASVRVACKPLSKLPDRTLIGAEAAGA
jgi:hypothetical protein